MQMDAKGMHDELMALLLNNPDLTNSDTSSLVRKFRIVLLKRDIHVPQAPNSLWGMSERSPNLCIHPKILINFL
jgi:hypothetical protein